MNRDLNPCNNQSYHANTYFLNISTVHRSCLTQYYPPHLPYNFKSLFHSPAISPHLELTSGGQNQPWSSQAAPDARKPLRVHGGWRSYQALCTIFPAYINKPGLHVEGPKTFNAICCCHCHLLLSMPSVAVIAMFGIHGICFQWCDTKRGYFHTEIWLPETMQVLEIINFTSTITLHGVVHSENL